MENKFIGSPENVIVNKFKNFSNFVMSYDGFVYVIIGGWDYIGNIPDDPRQEALNIFCNGIRLGRSMGVDPEDLFSVHLYIVISEKGEIIRRFLKGLFVEQYGTGIAGNAPVGRFPLIHMELVPIPLLEGLNVLAWFEFSDHDGNFPNDGRSHFELSDIPNILFPRDLVCSSLAVVKRHLFSAPIFNCTPSETGWQLTKNIGDSWNLLMQKMHWIGANFRQLGYLSIQTEDIDKQMPVTFEYIKKIFNNPPAIDIFQGEEYILTPECFFGNEEPSQTFTGKQTITYINIPNSPLPRGPYNNFVRMGKWIKTSFFPTSPDLSLIQQVFPKITNVLLIKIRVIQGLYHKYLPEIQQSIQRIWQKNEYPLVLIIPCRKLPFNYQMTVSFIAAFA